MSWDVEEVTNPVAKKEYRCDAMEWIINRTLQEGDVSPDHWAKIQKAMEEKCKILPGTKYIKVRGRWEGEWCTFRARPEINYICQHYDIYED